MSSNKGFAHLLLIIPVVILAIAVIAYLVYSNNLTTQPVTQISTAPPTPSPSASLLKTEYQNPFSSPTGSSTSYSNPFTNTSYQNPFDNLTQ